jgi:hypothetical protein
MAKSAGRLEAGLFKPALKWLVKNVERGSARRVAGDLHLGRRVPQGFTERGFRRFARGARQLCRRSGLPEGELLAHGSRVRGTARAASDIDVALRVDDKTFFDLAENALSRAHPGTKLRASMLKRINGNGQLSSFDLGPEFQRMRRELMDSESPFKVQFSVLRRGGKLDNGPWLPL